MKVFFDTSAFVAYFLRQEAKHKQVTQQYALYRKQNALFLTSNYILDELFTWFSSHQTKYTIEKLRDALEESEKNEELSILYINKVIDTKARDVLLKFAEHKISFTDATTYVLYKDFKLDEIFTLDSDFKKMRLSTSF